MVTTYTDVYVSTNLSDLSDWETFVPTTVGFNSASSSDYTIPGRFTTASAIQTVFDIIGSFNTGSAISSYSSVFNTWTSSSALVSGTGLNTPSYFSVGTVTDIQSDIIDDIWTGSLDYYGYIRVENELYYLTALRSKPNDTINEARVYIGVVNATNSTYVEAVLANSKIYNDIIDLFCCSRATASGIKSDIDLGIGRVTYIRSDLFAVSSGTGYIDTSILCSTSGTLGFYIDFDPALGRTSCYDCDLYSSTLGYDSIVAADIRIWSLSIGNFFLDEHAFCSANTVMYVDIVDGLFTVNTDNCYFTIDGSPVVCTFSPISGGYRMYYDPVDDFEANGTITVVAHAENIVGDALETTYYLLYGYNVSYTSRELWDPAEQIFVRMAANNLANCVNIEGSSFYFETVDLPSYDLQVSITPVDHVGLSAEIYPQSTAFFYNGTYTVRVTGVKDLNGNIMEDLVFSFKIENPTV